MGKKMIYSTRLSGVINPPLAKRPLELAFKMAAVSLSQSEFTNVKGDDIPDELTCEIKAAGAGIELLFTKPGAIVTPSLDTKSAFLSLFSQDIYEDEKIGGLIEKDAKPENALEICKDIVIDGDVSARSFGAFLIGLMVYGSKTNITVNGKVDDEEYLSLCLEMIRSFGGNIMNKGTKSFEISGHSKIVCANMKLEGDWNIIAFASMLSCFGLNVKVSGTDGIFSVQKGGQILLPISRLGYERKKDPEGNISFELPAAKMNSISIDCTQCAEYLPYVVLLASFSGRKTLIYNISPELPAYIQDRIVWMVDELEKAGVMFRSESDSSMSFAGEPSLEGGLLFDGRDDYVISTMLMMISMLSKKGNTIENIGIIDRMYPMFWNDFVKHGGFYDEL